VLQFTLVFTLGPCLSLRSIQGVILHQPEGNGSTCIVDSTPVNSKNKFYHHLPNHTRNYWE